MLVIVKANGRENAEEVLNVTMLFAFERTHVMPAGTEHPPLLKLKSGGNFKVIVEKRRELTLAMVMVR